VSTVAPNGVSMVSTWGKEGIMSDEKKRIILRVEPEELKRIEKHRAHLQDITGLRLVSLGKTCRALVLRGLATEEPKS